MDISSGWDLAAVRGLAISLRLTGPLLQTADGSPLQLVLDHFFVSVAHCCSVRERTTAVQSGIRLV